MSVPVRAPAFRTRPTRRASGPITAVGAALALVLASACANASPSTSDVALPRAVPGQPAGTIAVPVGTDVPTAVQRVRDAITRGGGTVLTVVDHAANARAAGVQIPPMTSVIGGPPAAGLPQLRLDQRAGANLPQHYLIRQAPDGSTTLTTNTAEYVAAVSQVASTDARTPLHDSTLAVLNAVAPGSGTVPTALVGVTPFQYLVTVPGGADVAVTAERLRRAANRAPARSVAVLDMAAGSAEGGPAIRPTSLVLATVPDAEAALLAGAPTIGLDLPLRFLVWRDEQNRTQIAHPDVRRIALRHGVNPDDPAVVRLVAETDRLARLGAGIVQ